MLIIGICIALLAISSVEVRKSDTATHQERAKANARLALTMAIGQLQLTMGPDTRVSASSSLVLADGPKHWTGVWNTQASDGKPWVIRDPETGGLTDRRDSQNYDRSAEVMQWLVSGDARSEENWVTLVGPGSVSAPDVDGVRVPSIAIQSGNEISRLAWWTGDLGQRANLAAGGRAEQTPASELMDAPLPIPPKSQPAMASDATIALHSGDPRWAKSHFHDFTANSVGLLVDARNGGFKKDLGVYLRGSADIADTDRLAGPANEQAAAEDGLLWGKNPLRDSSPRFGLLRHFASLADTGNEAITPETTTAPATANQILSNLKPAVLDGSKKSSLQPILVEAAEFHSFSWFKKSGSATHRHHLRKHLYPRITLWNPYATPLTTRPMMILLQVNGRYDFWIDGFFPGPKGKPNSPVRSPWIAFDGGRSRDFYSADGSPFNSPGFQDPHMGSHYYQLAATTFGPGECLVFTPPQSAEYQNGIQQDGPEYDLAANLLTPSQAPSPARCFTISSPPGQTGFDFTPTSISMKSTASYFKLFKMKGLSEPLDDLRVILKDLAGETNIDVETFDLLPQIALLAGSLRYGTDRANVAPWTGNVDFPIEETTNQPPGHTPDGRTRQGLRLRSGKSPTAPTEALLANWNLRAAYSLRSPCDRLRPAEAHPGLTDAPSGFGSYEQFLPTDPLSWNERFPVAKNGTYHASPVDFNSSGDPTILFDLPRKTKGVLSLGQLQHAKISDLIWHPSFPIGNSLADPRLPLTSTLPEKRKYRGFSAAHIGYSKSSPSPDSWSATARSILLNFPENDAEFLYDLSYETNHTLWDSFFISSSDATRITEFAHAPFTHFLPNSRLQLSLTSPAETLQDLHQAASVLTVSGAFNVNSVSEKAWAAVLASHRKLSDSGTFSLFPHIAERDESPRLSDEQIRRLAAAIVAEVKLRGPFLGMSDFVNRRLTNDVTGRRGAFEAAIHAAGLNAKVIEKFPLLDDQASITPPEITQPLDIDPTLKPETTAWGTEPFITQADILQNLGDSLTARSDTFAIRAYGESTDASGKTHARAWCEAILQRDPQPVKQPSEPTKQDTQVDFGRRFKIIQFRWLSPAEI